MKRAVFLDRDDTLIVNVPYLGDPSRVVLCPGAASAVSRLRDAGYLLVLVSNQSGVGRGLITKQQVADVNREMVRQLGLEGFDGEYFCYAAPGDPYGSEERKPAPILLQRAAQDLDINLEGSFMVGDKDIDVECGHRAGCQSVLVMTGDESPARQSAEKKADFVAPDVGAASEWIVKGGRE